MALLAIAWRRLALTTSARPDPQPNGHAVRAVAFGRTIDRYWHLGSFRIDEALYARSSWAGEGTGGFLKPGPDHLLFAHRLVQGIGEWGPDVLQRRALARRNDHIGRQASAQAATKLGW
jgi:hypothetical protein